jgi:hypothetical protein
MGSRATLSNSLARESQRRIASRNARAGLWLWSGNHDDGSSRAGLSGGRYLELILNQPSIVPFSTRPDSSRAMSHLRWQAFTLYHFQMAILTQLVAQELTLSFVPDAEQRLWWTVTRRKHQLTRNRVQLHNRESLLEEAHLKLSRLVSDLLGLSARRMLNALAEGRNQPSGISCSGRPSLTCY